MSVMIFEAPSVHADKMGSCLGDHCPAFTAILASVEAGDSAYYKNNVALMCGLGRGLGIQYNSDCADVSPEAEGEVENA